MHLWSLQFVIIFLTHYFKISIVRTEIQFEQTATREAESLPELYDSDDDDDGSASQSIRPPGYARILLQKQQEMFLGFFQILVSLVFLGKLRGEQRYIATAAPSQEVESSQPTTTSINNADAQTKTNY